MQPINCLESLPEHIFKQVLQYLNYQELFNLSLTSTEHSGIKPHVVTHVAKRKALPNQNRFRYRGSQSEPESESETEEEEKKQGGEKKLEEEQIKPQNFNFDQDNIDHLYHKVNAPHQIDVDGRYLQLAAIHLSFLSKDQGWASVNESSSWIEACFLKQNQLNYQEIELDRKTLVTNFRQKKWKETSILITDEDILSNLAQIKIYLKARYPGWRSFCKKSKVKLVYS